MSRTSGSFTKVVGVVALCTSLLAVVEVAPRSFTGQRPQRSAAPRTAVREMLLKESEEGRAWAPPIADMLKEPQVVKFLERHVIDEEAMAKEQEFPIRPQDLIGLAKYFLATESPDALPVEFNEGRMLADGFRFVGPVIGPLDRDEFVTNVKLIEFYDIFPDTSAQYHHFRVDPFEPSRVWFTCRATGTNTGRARPGSDTHVLAGEPTGRRFESAPEACSLRFTEQGLVDQFTIGYVMDRSIGNTGGLGGFFGPLYAVGKNFPFPEGKPWQPSLMYQAYVNVGAFFNRLRCRLEGLPEERKIYMPKGTTTLQ